MPLMAATPLVKKSITLNPADKILSTPPKTPESPPCIYLNISLIIPAVT